MKKKLFYLALMLFSATGHAYEGNGYKILSEKFTVTGGTGNLLELPVKKNFLKPGQSFVSARTRDVSAKVLQFAELDSWHSVGIYNATPTVQRYTYQYHLICGQVIGDFVRQIELTSGGSFSDDSMIRLAGQATAAGRYPILVFTRVSGAELSYQEAHAMFTAT